MCSPSRSDLRLSRDEAGQRLHGTLGLHLLDERECGIDQDHYGNRDRDGDDPGDPGEAGRRDEQEREWMRELPRQLSRPASSSAPAQLVGTELDESALSLARAEAVGGRLEPSQQLVGRLSRVEARR